MNNYGNYYTLIWKINGLVSFNSFISFEGLKDYVRDYIKNGQVKDLKAVDDDMTIWYLETDKKSSGLFETAKDIGLFNRE